MNGLRCPECGHGHSWVIDSRESVEESIRRRRACDKCGHRFTTYERTEPVIDTLAEAKRERDELIEAMQHVIARRAADSTAHA